VRRSVSRYLAVTIVSATLFPSILIPAAAMASIEPDISASDVCGHVQNRAVHDLIASPGDGTFTIDSNQNEPGKLTCVWTALKTGATSGSVPDATLTLDLYHFANIARARKELQSFGAAPRTPQPLQTDNADDEVIQLSPVMAAARHGQEIAVARITVPDSISGRPNWNSRFEALTLIASGARLLASPEPSASSAPLPNAEPSAWRPPDRVLPASSAIFVPIVHGMWRLTHWRFECMPVAIVLSLLIGFIAVKLRRFWILWLVPIVFGYALLNLINGSGWVAGLIYHFGTPAQATVTGTFPTNDIYNNQNVVGFHVLIRSTDGPVIESRFRSDDFNVYPPRNATRYPDQGDVFTVRYLRGHPDDFVIVRDDGSPWSQRLRCEDLVVKARQADQKTSFAPQDSAFQQAAQAAHAALQSAGCLIDDSSD
jgi:hypothetical protein